MSGTASKTVEIIISQESAERSLEALQKKADTLNKSIAKNRDAGKDVTNELKKLGETQKDIDLLTKVMDGKMAPTLKMVQKEVVKLRNELKGMSKDDPGFDAKVRQYEKANAQLSQMQGNITRIGKAIKESSLWDTIKGVAIGTIVGNTVQAGVDRLIGYINSMISNNARLSDSLADLQRVAGLTHTEVRALYEDLRKLNTRTSMQGLMDIAVIAGKLGVAKDDILGFVQATDKLVVALGDELGNADQITTDLGKILNVFTEGPVTGDKLMAVGNAIVDLANKGVATGGFIVDFTTRLAGLAQTADISLSDTLGLAAGLEELGQKSESSSTAIIKIMGDIGANTSMYAEILKMSNEEFNKMFAAKPIETLLKIAEALTQNKQGFAEITTAFKNAGEDGARVISVLGVMGEKAGFLREKLKEAGSALQSTDQIQQAFSLKNETLGAILEKTGKKIGSWFANSGISDGIKTMIIDFGRLTGAVKKLDEANATLERQQMVVRQLNNEVVPLVNEYDKLKEKGALSADEQKRLNDIIADISKSVPYAIEQIDAYGNVLSISSDKTREYIRLQQAMLEVKNKEAIAAARSDLKRAEEEVSDLEDEIASKQRVAEKRKAEGRTFIYNYVIDEIGKLNSKLIEAKTNVIGLRGLLNSLSGRPLTGEDTKPTIEIPVPHGYTKEDITGTSNTKTASNASSTPDKNAQKKIDQVRSEINRLSRELAAKAADAAKDRKANDEQEINEIREKYLKLVALAKGYNSEILQLRKLEKQELDLLIKKQFEERSTTEYEQSLKLNEDFYNKQRAAAGEAYQKQQIDHAAYTRKMVQLDHDEAEDRATIAQDYITTSSKAASDAEKLKTEAVRKGVKEREDLEVKESQNRIYEQQRRALTAKKGTKAELDAHIQLIEVQFEEETRLLNRNSDEYKLRVAQRDNAILEAKRDFYNSLVQIASDALHSIMDATQAYVDFQNAKDNELLKNEQKVYDKKQQSLKESLDSKKITQQEYDKQMADAQRKFAAEEETIKRRQFERNKRYAIANANMQGAQAVMSVWAQANTPYWLKVGETVAIVANTGLQIARIRAEKYAKGGIPKGPSHANGGISLIDNATGQPAGEMEGGEPIISKNTYQNNKGIVDALLYSGMYNGGKSISWINKQPARLNTSLLYETVAANHVMKSGGYAIGAHQSATASTTTTTANTDNSKMMYALLVKLNDKLDEPIRAVLPWTDIRDKNDTYYNELQRSSSMRVK